MMSHLRLFSFCLFLSSSLFISLSLMAETSQKEVFSQDIYIEAEGGLTSSESFPDRVEVIEGSVLNAKKSLDLSSSLEESSGLHIENSGGPGQIPSFFIRGVASSDILVLQDGVAIHDPSSPGRSVDLSMIRSSDVERIEILKGPQSGRWGSQSMGAVINIVTKKPSSKPSLQIYNELHTLQGGSLGAGYAARYKEWRYRLSLHHEKSAGISAVGHRDDKDLEKDGYSLDTASLSLGRSISKYLDAVLLLRTSQRRQDLDQYGGTEADDPNYVMTSKEDLASLSLRTFLLQDRIEFGANFSHFNKKRFLLNEKDYAEDMSEMDMKYLGKNQDIELYSSYTTQQKHHTRVGVKQQQESFASENKISSEFNQTPLANESSKIDSFYISQYLQLKPSMLELSLRTDRHDRSGLLSTYRLSYAYELSRQKLIKTNFSTGAKSPSLFQLYSDFGNKDLSYEQSRGADISFQDFNKVGEGYSFTVFGTRFKDKIDYDFEASRYSNKGSQFIHGIELNGSLLLASHLLLHSAFTLQSARNVDKDEELLRRPKLYGNVSLEWKNKSYLLRPLLRYVGSRPDIDKQLPAYALLDLYAQTDLSSKIRIYSSVYNILDEDYESVSGYGSPGRWFVAGIQWTVL